MKYTFFIRMGDLHAMLITNITHSAYYTVEMGVSAGYLTRITLDSNHTADKHICLQGIGCVSQKLPARNSATIVINACNHRQCWKSKWCNHRQGHIFFCHYYIVWGSNNAGEARRQSWKESPKSRWIPGGSCGYTSGTKRNHFAAFLPAPRPCWRWLPLQPSCGSPQWSDVWESDTDDLAPGGMSARWLLASPVCHLDDIRWLAK